MNLLPYKKELIFHDHLALKSQLKKPLVHDGFALIATISIMTLLVLIALAMLSLSTIEVRSARASEAMEEARSNARLALMLAIADLQAKAGADTRVTAPADAVAGAIGTAPRQVTGVWRSWEGNDHDKSTGLPTAPDYGSKLNNGDLEAQSTNDGRFLGWLISGIDKDNPANSSPSLVEGVNTIPLVAEGTLGAGSTDLEVHIVPSPLVNGGSIAYWIQGENTKALIQPELQNIPVTRSEWSQRMASSGRADTETFGFDMSEELLKGVSHKTLELISNSEGGDASKFSYYDITTYSRGLLTNTANGGWRRDLSLMAESWSEGGLSSTGLEVFSREPYEPAHTASLKMIDNSSDASIYPWAVVDNISMSWNALMDYTSLYKKVKKHPNNEPFFDAIPNANSDWVSIWPTLARMHWAFGFDAKVITPASATSEGEYEPRLLMKPSTTLWNPYNVAIEAAPVITEARLRDNFFPFNLYLQIGSRAEVELDIGAFMAHRSGLDDDTERGTATRSRIFSEIARNANSSPIIKPGESRIFGMLAPDTAWSTQWLSPGINIAGNLNLAFNQRDPSILNGAGDDTFRYRWDHRVVNENIDMRVEYLWSQSDNIASEEGATYKNRSRNYYVRVPADQADEKIPLPDPVNDDETLASAALDDSPFIAVSMGLRTLVDEKGNGLKKHTKGYFNSKLISSSRGVPLGAITEESPYTWEVFAPNSWSDSVVPDPGSNNFGADVSGLIGRSFKSGEGLERWTIAELPTQPLLSLGQLQHFDSSWNNNKAPRTANAIGNSHASPFIARNEILINQGEGAGRIEAHDHSYVNNHIFFDDWFFSTIVPDYEVFTQQENRSIKEVYSDHLTGTQQLANSQYRPARLMRQDEADEQADLALDEDDVWLNIGAEIEVEGMFNINSTSVAAWRSLLLSQKNALIPNSTFGTSSATDWRTDLSSSPETVFSRTTVAGDPLSASNPDISLLAIPMSMNESEIDALAVGIVEQIKKRGPFLSLSEFINRQLSNDEDLALAGAIETALIELSESSVNNPYREIQTFHSEQVVLPDDAALIYPFPKAAEGYAAYGTPGWARQADVIRSLAPIMTARDDTFKIRAYGEAKDAQSGVVTARSWCEAVVQRNASYVSPENSRADAPHLLSDLNKIFGRRFEIVSFRWLTPEEV